MRKDEIGNFIDDKQSKQVDCEKVREYFINK